MSPETYPGAGGKRPPSVVHPTGWRSRALGRPRFRRLGGIDDLARFGGSLELHGRSLARFPRECPERRGRRSVGGALTGDARSSGGDGSVSRRPPRARGGRDRDGKGSGGSGLPPPGRRRREPVSGAGRPSSQPPAIRGRAPAFVTRCDRWHPGGQRDPRSIPRPSGLSLERPGYGERVGWQRVRRPYRLRHPAGHRRRGS